MREEPEQPSALDAHDATKMTQTEPGAATALAMAEPIPVTCMLPATLEREEANEGQGMPDSGMDSQLGEAPVDAEFEEDAGGDALEEEDDGADEGYMAEGATPASTIGAAWLQRHPASALCLFFSASSSEAFQKSGLTCTILPCSISHHVLVVLNHCWDDAAKQALRVLLQPVTSYMPTVMRTKELPVESKLQWHACRRGC